MKRLQRQEPESQDLGHEVHHATKDGKIYVIEHHGVDSVAEFKGNYIEAQIKHGLLKIVNTEGAKRNGN